ncbi:MAG TPA: transporter substrate-binding domain-containing protein [Spirochaetales bacterium]|nr:transporter substrate-binding domain-containing protein [Spirochaetales bacterium]
MRRTVGDTGPALYTEGMRRVLTLLAVIVASAQAALAAPALTPLERSWLDARGELVFAVNLDVPPYGFVHPQSGDATGLNVELARWLAAELGFRIRFLPVHPNDAFDAVDSGKAIAYFGLIRTANPDGRLALSSEVFNVPVSIFVLRGRPDMGVGYDALSGPVAFVQDGSIGTQAAWTGMASEPVPVPDAAAGLEAILSGGVDALIAAGPVLLYHARSVGAAERLESWGEPIALYSAAMAVGRSNGILLSILEKGLAQARQTGIVDKLEAAWLGQPQPEPDQGPTSLGIMVMALGAALIVAGLGAVAWRWLIRTAVDTRTQKLSKANAELRKLSDELTAGKLRLARDVDERARLEDERRMLEARMARTRSFGMLATMDGGLLRECADALTQTLCQADMAGNGAAGNADQGPALPFLKEAARRAGVLVHRMTSAGGSAPDAAVVDLGMLAGRVVRVLSGAVTSRLKLTWIPPASAVLVHADPGRLRKALAAVVANAAESLSGSNMDGEIRIRVGSATFEKDELPVAVLGRQPVPGSYAALEFTSITPDHSGHSAKPSLADGGVLGTLAGLIADRDWWISVGNDASGHPATILYMPPAREQPASSPGPAAEAPVLSGVVLIADGDAGVRAATSALLRSLGAATLEAGDLPSALSQASGMDLIPAAAIVDLDLPGPGDAATSIKALKPDLVLIATASVMDATTLSMFERGAYSCVLKKPYGLDDLVSAIKECVPGMLSPAPRA